VLNIRRKERVVGGVLANKVRMRAFKSSDIETRAAAFCEAVFLYCLAEANWRRCHPRSRHWSSEAENEGYQPSCAWSDQAREDIHAAGEPKPLFDFAQQHQNAAIRRQQAPIKFEHTGLPLTDGKPGSGSIGTFMAGVAAWISFDNQILREIRYLSYIR
jgi:hypothetical protein